MDKSWINIPHKGHPLYEKGAEDFVKFASDNSPNAERILCPCKKCRNCIFVKKDDVVEHIILNRFLESYTCWTFHGESSSSSFPPSESVVGDEMREMIHDAFGILPPIPLNFMDEGEGHQHMEGPDEENKKFFNLIKEVERELYPDCKKYSMLSFLVRLLHIKCLGGWSDKTFTMLLELLKDALPEGETLPKSFYEARKLIGNLGLDYRKIHACPNDCMLYYNETEKENECRQCHTPRYKQLKGESNDDATKDRKIPAKVVRYFPLIPRLQRLFMSSKTASQMRWHADERVDDGNIRHPADSLAWKIFDKIYPDFAEDPRNVRLGLSSDGFNPFRTMSIAHSTWPIILMPYNLPPWLCMKQSYMILTVLIDGPRGPGNDIDIYLRPLIDELKELWVGVDTYDASSNHMFKMRASLLWTISDFPAYANLSGWSTKGQLACPCCHKYTRFRWLSKGRKHCYMGHRRWLPEGHKFRMDKISFDGTIELDTKPTRLSGAEVYEEVKDFNNKFGKNLQSEHKRKRGDNEDGNLTYNWKKQSIFFELDYWKDNLIRHNLDIMHIEKNVCDNVLFTLLNVDGKGKDNLNARLDLKEIGILKPLHPQQRANNKYYLPPACFTLDNKGKDMLCKTLKKVKVPDGYSSNISRRVNLKQRTISGLKSHDNHILMQELLPIALRNVLPKNVIEPLIELSNFFRSMYSKVMNITDLDQVQSRIELTLCHLERIFPPSFFDVMEHLVIHLAEEAKIGGPPQYRSMYPIERFGILVNIEELCKEPKSSRGLNCTRILGRRVLNILFKVLTNSLMHSGWGEDGGILQIQVNEFGQPIEKHASRLASNLGGLARNGHLAPLTYVDWRHVPDYKKDILWNHIKENTNATDVMKKFMMESIGRKWKEWKATVKRQGYNRYETNAERLAHCPQRVEEAQWRKLIYHWDSAEAKAKSAKNKAIRALVTTPHTSGRTTHAQVREKIHKEIGFRPTRRMVYTRTHVTKGKGPVSEAAAQAINEMDTLELQHPETAETGVARDDIFGQVMGPERHGRVRTFGLGVSPSIVFGSSYKQSQAEMRDIDTRHQQELARMQREMEAENDRKQAEMKAHMEAQMEEKISSMQSRMEAQMREFLDAHMRVIGGVTQSARDVSSGTGEVPDEPNVDLLASSQLHPERQYQSEVQSHRRSKPLTQAPPKIISRSQLQNYCEDLRASKKAKKHK